MELFLFGGHQCIFDDLILLKLYYNDYGQSLGVYRCKVCGQHWKLRLQYDHGTGRDNIWLNPGENQRGYSFGFDELHDLC